MVPMLANELDNIGAKPAANERPSIHPVPAGFKPRFYIESPQCKREALSERMYHKVMYE